MIAKVTYSYSFVNYDEQAKMPIWSGEYIAYVEMPFFTADFIENVKRKKFADSKAIIRDVEISHVEEVA
jgi:hypothetical protein